MGEPVYVSRLQVVQEKRPQRQITFQAFPDRPFHVGTHSGIAAHYQSQPEEPHPATLDYVVAAAAG